MSIPVTASAEPFVPACMAEIEGAPTFRFRHATVLDKHRYLNLYIEEGLRQHSDEALREAIIEQLRTEFYSEGMEQNITRLIAYWAALDEHKSAMRQHNAIVADIEAQHEGDGSPELPPEPVLDFPEAETDALDDIVDQVREESPRVRKMLKQNHWHSVMMPRLMLRMFLTATSLPVKLRKADGMLTAESADAVFDALAKEATRAGVSADTATAQLQVKAMLSFSLEEDAEKNSSSPRSGPISPKSSASTQSSGLPTETTPSQSSDPATSDEDNGSSSSDCDSPAQA